MVGFGLGPSTSTTVTKPYTGGTSFSGMAGGLIGGALNLASTIFGNRARKRALDDARRYDHPAQQMKRLQEAGLNPNLIYGEGVSGASGASHGAPEVQNPKIEALKDILAFQNVKREKATTDLLHENVISQKRDNELKWLDIQNKADERMYGSMTVPAMQARNREALAKAGLSENQLEILTRTKNAQVQKAIQEAMRARFSTSNEEKLGTLRELEASLKEAQIKFYDANQIVSIITRILGLRK